MGICSNTCLTRPPQLPTDGCIVDKRKGGINRLIFFSCDINQNDLGRIEEWSSRTWCNLVYQRKIVVTSALMGEKPKGSATSRRFSSCAPESVTGYERTITFEDLSADNIEYSDFDFWNKLSENPGAFQLGYLDCDGYFTGVIPNFTIEVSPVNEDVNTGSSMWSGNVAWTGIEMPKPFFVPELLSMLTGNCDGVPGFNGCASLPSLIIESDTTILCAEGGIRLRAPLWLNISNYTWTIDGNPAPEFDGLDEIYAIEPGDYVVSMRRESCGVTDVSVTKTLTRRSDSPCFGTITPSGPDVNGYYSVVITLDTVSVNCQPTAALIQTNIITPSGFSNGWGNTLNFTRLRAGRHVLQLRNINTGCLEEREIILG